LSTEQGIKSSQKIPSPMRAINKGIITHPRGCAPITFFFSAFIFIGFNLRCEGITINRLVQRYQSLIPETFLVVLFGVPKTFWLAPLSADWIFDDTTS
jgi:hypothetical protein